MLLGTYYTLPIMLALCLMLLGTYYAQNYAGIIGRSLFFPDQNFSKMLPIILQKYPIILKIPDVFSLVTVFNLKILASVYS